MGDLKSDQAKILRDFDSAEISSETVSHCFLAQLDSPDTACAAAADAILKEVEGKILWRSPVHGQPVGKQNVDEILAIWYPSHQAFVNIKDAPSSARFAEAKNKVVKHAVIHRGDPYTVERTP